MEARTSKVPVHQLTPDELEAESQPHVEDRLNSAEQTISLLMILTRAVSQSDDLAFYPDQSRPGWAFASELAADVLADVQAIQHALPGPVQFTKAPRKERA
jgi:hypothetical protein